MSDPKRDDFEEADAATAAPKPNGGAAVTLESLVEGPDAPAADTRAQRIADLEAQVKALEDQKLRLVADAQNASRRYDRDKREAEAHGGAKLAKDLIAVHDNLEQAVALASDTLKEQESGFFNGVELTLKTLLSAFAKHKIEPVRPEIGEKFDPNLHQAVFEAPVPGAEPGTVIQVMQAGFVLGERLLRPAFVGVAARSQEAPKVATPADAAG